MAEPQTPSAARREPAHPRREWDDSLFVDVGALRARLNAHAENFNQPEPDAGGPSTEAAPDGRRRPTAWDIPRNDAALGDIVRFTQGLVPLELPHPSQPGATVKGTMMDWHVTLRPPSEEHESTFESTISAADRVALLDSHWEVLASLLTPDFDPTSVDDATPQTRPSSTLGAAWAPRPVTLTELMWLRSDASAMDRYQYSYGVMLLWFGWRLHDGMTGELDRHRDWRTRYEALEALPQRGAVVSRRVVRLLRSLLFVGARTFADKLVHFVSQELREGRLHAFRDEFERVWLPVASAVSPTATVPGAERRFVAEWAPGLETYSGLVRNVVDASDSE